MKTSSNPAPDHGQTEEHASTRQPKDPGRFWDRHAAGYAAKPVANQKAYEHKLAVTRGYLNAESQVLELGCGTGSTALIHAPQVCHIRATDVSGKMIDIARQKAADAGVTNVDFICSAADQAFAPNAKYDAILALNLLHLLPAWRQTINTAYRRLQPGGVFVTSTLCLKDTHAWLRWITPIGRAVGLMPMLNFLTRQQLKAQMCSAGFQIEHAWQADRRNGLLLVARRPS